MFQTMCDALGGKSLVGAALHSETSPLLPSTGSPRVNDRSPPTDAEDGRCASPACPQPESPGAGRCSACRHWGLLLALVAALSSSLVSVVVQQLSDVDPACLSAFRFLSIVPLAGLEALRRGQDIFPRGHRTVLLLRAVLGAAALICKFYALRRMLLADASVLLLSAPVFVSVWACLLLGEPCGALHVMSLLATISGAMMIVRPKWMRSGARPYIPSGVAGADDTVSLAGAALALASALFLSAAYVTLRRLQSVHWSATVLVFGVVGAVMSYTVWLATGAGHSPSSAAEWLMVLALGALTMVMQLAFTVACQLEQAGPVAVVRTSEIVFAVVWQVAFFHCVPGPYTVAGMVLVMMSVLAVALHKCITQRREDGRP
ncbi:Solute carrier family 35 member G1 [Amphibalanus amphitrite]|uniref:Solute carrier family 35 member G1 n=2 Tax=Amphibalanus amphitrite TaxID=1232801 RepID=A0A6A4W3T7_AMPAM|nr:Solute carrier family 35 member G1 [Amphibalanus amphitrite]